MAYNIAIKGSICMMKWHGVDPLEHESDNEVLQGLEANRIVGSWAAANRDRDSGEVMLRQGNQGNNELM